MLIYQAAKQNLLKFDSRSKLYERYKLKRSDKHQMSKLAIVAIKLLTSGGCDQKGHGNDNFGSSEPVPQF